MNNRFPSSSIRRCVFYSLTALIFIFALVCIGVWLEDALLPSWSVSTLIAVFIFFVSVAVAVTLVCVIFRIIEKVTGPLFP